MSTDVETPVLACPIETAMTFVTAAQNVVAGRGDRPMDEAALRACLEGNVSLMETSGVPVLVQASQFTRYALGLK